MNSEIEVCETCYLVECCCEADRLQVIADDRKAVEDGYFPTDLKNNGDIRWIKKRNVKQQQTPTTNCVLCGSQDNLVETTYREIYEESKTILVCKNCLNGPKQPDDDDNIERMLEDYYDYEAEIAMGK